MLGLSSNLLEQDPRVGSTWIPLWVFQFLRALFTQSSRALGLGVVDNKLMELLFRRSLSLIICVGASAQVFAQDTGANATTTPTPASTPSGTGKADKLDDAAEVQLQQSLNDIYNKYNTQISGIKAQADQLASTGYSQCELDAKTAENEAASQESQAKMQALQGMIEPGAKTLGHLVDAGMKGAGGEKATQNQKLDTLVKNCNEQGKYIPATTAGAPPVQVFSCTTSGVTVTKSKCASMTGQDSINCQTLASDATSFESQIATTNKELNDLGGATDGLISSGMQLAAAGIGGMMMNKQGKEMAAYLKENAAGQEDLCKKQVDAQITALNNQIAQLEAAKARDLLMANMMAEYQTKVRRENQVENIDEEDDPTNGGTIAIDGPGEIAGLPPVRTVPLTKNNGSGSGANAPAGGGGGGGAAAPPGWEFGQGGGFDGGSRLPDQPEAATYSGTGNAVGGSKGSGFGALDGKAGEGEKGDRSPAGEEGEMMGDGGLRVLLARTSLIHTKHATTLLKSIDFDRLAKSQGITKSKPASVAPAGPN